MEKVKVKFKATVQVIYVKETVIQVSLVYLIMPTLSNYYLNSHIPSQRQYLYYTLDTIIITNGQQNKKRGLIRKNYTLQVEGSYG